MTALPSKTSMLTAVNQGSAKGIFGDMWDFLLGLFGSDGTKVTARSTLGATTVGDALFTATDAASARSTIGAEASGNKVTSLASPDNTTFPTTQAVKTAIDTAVTGLLDDRGSYDASGNVWPSSGGSGATGTILKGDLWTISVAGTLGGTAVEAGDTIRALTDTPGSTAANWCIMDAPFTTAAQIHAAATKATPVDADEWGFWDSVSGALRKLTLANLKTALAATFASLASNNAFTRLSGPTPVAQTDGATVTWPVNTDQSVTLAMGGSRTVTTSGTPVAGVNYQLTITPTGTYTASFDSAKFKGLSGITQTATSGKTDCWTFRSDGTYLNCIGFRADIGS